MASGNAVAPVLALPELPVELPVDATEPSLVSPPSLPNPLLAGSPPSAVFPDPLLADSPPSPGLAPSPVLDPLDPLLPPSITSPTPVSVDALASFAGAVPEQRMVAVTGTSGAIRLLCNAIAADARMA